jgi:cytochrome c peroxidase
VLSQEGLRFRDVELPANLAREQIADLAVAGNGGTSFVRRVAVDAMPATLARQHTPVLRQVALKVNPFHAATSSSS